MAKGKKVKAKTKVRPKSKAASKKVVKLKIKLPQKHYSKSLSPWNWCKNIPTFFIGLCYSLIIFNLLLNLLQLAI